MNRIMQSKCVAAAIVAAALCSAFGAVWHDGDLTVVKGDPVTLTDKNMTNSCLVLHDNFTVKLGDKAHKYASSRFREKRFIDRVSFSCPEARRFSV